MSCDLNDIFKYAPCHKCHEVTNLVNQRMVLGFLYLKSGCKHETCFYDFRHYSTYVIQKWLKCGWLSRSN